MVVIIIGILASIALPQYLTVTKKGRRAEALATLTQLRSANARRQAEFGSCTATATDLDVTIQTTSPDWTFTIGTDCSATATGRSGAGTGGLGTGCTVIINADGSIGGSLTAAGTGC